MVSIYSWFSLEFDFCNKIFRMWFFFISFNNKSVIISRNGLNICTENSENNLYVLRSLMHESLLNIEMFKIEKSKTKRQKISYDDTYL